TQAKFLLKRLRGAHYISTGLLLRQFAKKNNPIAKRVRAILEKGFLTPGWLASFMWMRELIEAVKESEPLLLDGAPRQVYEAELLDEVMTWQKRPLPVALYINIGPKEAEKRLLLRGRGDDTKQAIQHRIKFFYRDVIPMVKYYRKHKRLIIINGEQAPEKVWRDIKKALHI
ncbi:nucleoside monophosphate kinase, partial [Patescibacteria group bacterium]|nr:nucleoside monophosphate kinase [Patescibacteria group bacterium]